MCLSVRCQAALFFGCSFFVAATGVLAGGERAYANPPDSRYCDSFGKCTDYDEAFAFLPLDQLDPAHSRFLPSLTSTYEKWVEEQDGEAAAFFAVSRALVLMEVQIDPEKQKW